MSNTENRIVFQPHLGEYRYVDNPEENMNSLTLGKVLNYNPKYNSATVMLLRSKNIIGGSGDENNKFGVRVGVSSSSYNEETLAVSGVIEPVQIGQLVVVAFLDGIKSQPIIITSLHDIWHKSKNILMDEVNPRIVDRNKYVKIFPSQSYVKVDGLGGLEWGHPSKSFMVATYDDIDVDTFNYEDLTEKHPVTGKSYESDILEASIPLSMVLCHRNHSDPSKETRVAIKKKGDISISRKNGNATSSMSISESGEVEMRHSTGSYIKLTNEGDVIISAQNEIIFINNGILKGDE